MKIGITVGVVIAIVALVAYLVPLKEVAYTVTVDYQDVETYYEDEPYEDAETYYESEPYDETETYYKTEPLQYRELDSFTTEAIKDVTRHASTRGYDLPDEIVEWPDFALYLVVQNLDDVPGSFEARYTLSTADKNAAERQQWLVQRTPEEYAELDREYYEGSIELYLESGEVGAAICPPGGIYIAPDRVPFSHDLEIIPDTKNTEKQRTVTKYGEVEKQRTVTKYRQVEKERARTKQRPGTRYRRVTLLDYLLHY